jgi:hypothetical protein
MKAAGDPPAASVIGLVLNRQSKVVRAKLRGHRSIVQGVGPLRRDRGIVPAGLDRGRRILAAAGRILTRQRGVADAILQRQLVIGAAMRGHLTNKRGVGPTGRHHQRVILAAALVGSLTNECGIEPAVLKDCRIVVAIRLRNDRRVIDTNLANKRFIAAGISY